MEEVKKLIRRIHASPETFRTYEEFSRQITPWNLDLFLEFLEAIPEKLGEVDEHTATNAAKAYSFLSCIEGALSRSLHKELHRYFHDYQTRNGNNHEYLSLLYFSN